MKWRLIKKGKIFEWLAYPETDGRPKGDPIPDGRGMKTEWATRSTHLSLSFPLCVMDITPPAHEVVVRPKCSRYRPAS